MFLRGRTMFAPTMTPNAISRQNKKLNPYPLFLLHIQAQKKKAGENFNFGSDKILIECYQR